METGKTEEGMPEKEENKNEMLGKEEEKEEKQEEDKDPVLTLDEVNEEIEALEADANAVLGAEDDSKCTYEQGYKCRQALYACRTCSKDANDQVAGVCLGCSLECHDNHDLVELYTKRSFRCDCGNSKFPNGFSCKLYSAKDPTNDMNAYNHNFTGLYCKCDRPYPDLDDSVQDEMVQCVVCEDWYHTRHLSNDETMVSLDNVAEVTCLSCVQKLSFLLVYYQKITGDDDSEKDKAVDVIEEAKSDICPLTDDSWKDNSEPKSLFWSIGWRQLLCNCENCQHLYEQSKCKFLLDEEDSVSAYESPARNGTQTDTIAAGMKAFSSKFDRTQQIEMAHGYNNLKENLTSYLKRFAESGQVVKETDINEFFDGLKAQKRPRLELPEHCRW